MFSALQSYLPEALKCMALTVIIELLIALAFKIRRFKLIVIVNISTQLLLHIILLTTFYTTLYRYSDIIFKCTEVAILFIEFLIYSLFIKDRKKPFIFLYTFIANLTTFLIGFII